MIEGLNSVTNLLRLYRIKEMFYLRDADISDKPAHLNFVRAVVELYSNIFEYQARMTCHLSQSSLKRVLRGTLELDDWGGMLKKIEASSDTCDQYCIHLDRTRESKFFDDESTHMLRSLDLQKRILDILETSQTSRQQDSRSVKEAELLELLASNYKSDKDSVSVRVPGTCEWFFADDKFLSWRDSKHSRLLWVSAGPGCGKSVLSRSLIDERRVTTIALNSTVCYFFFKDGQEQRMSGANALSAILHQLFENTGLIGNAFSSAKSYGNQLRDNFSELWGILMRCARDSEAGDIICVLDALDECEKDSRYQLLKKLMSFSKVEAQQSPCKLRFLVTSRPYDDLEDGFQAMSTFNTYLRLDGDEKSRMIGEEINLVIDHEMPRIAKGFSVQHCERISNRLKEMDNRNYLWLFLTLGIITASRSKYSKMSSIESLLSSLPSKISDAYEEILSRSSDEATARVLLQLIMAATRPLSLHEINIALTLATQKGKFTSHEVLNQDLWPSQDFKSIVRNMCGLFVSVHDGKLSLIHQTAREFLARRGTDSPKSGSCKWQGYINMATAHSTIFQICFDYLNFDEFVGIPQAEIWDEDCLQERGNSYCLLNYAAVNWPVHYISQGEQRAAESRKAAHNLCNISLPKRSCWFETYCDFHHRSYHSRTSLGIACLLGLRQVAEIFIDEGDDVNAEPIEGPTPLEAAAGQGHFEVVQMLLDKGASIDTEYRVGNALYEASYQRHHRVVQLLLDRGADINARSAYYGNALKAASYRGDIQVVQLLIDRGADVNAQGGRYGNALQTASANGHIEIVQSLLDQGADVNAQGGHFGTALQAASRNGRIEILQILLDKGADVNARGGCFGNALQAASAYGRTKNVHILLDKGADINARVGIYGNALQAASDSGHDQVVQILLDRGADVNARGGRYGNALHAASSGGHAQVVQILLDRGINIDAPELDEALKSALEHGHDQIVQLLLDKGAVISAQRLGDSLHDASRRGQTQMVQVLLGKGPDIDAQHLDKALRAARGESHDEIVQLLLDKGAKNDAGIEWEDEVMDNEDNTSTLSSLSTVSL